MSLFRKGISLVSPIIAFCFPSRKGNSDIDFALTVSEGSDFIPGRPADLALFTSEGGPVPHLVIDDLHLVLNSFSSCCVLLAASFSTSPSFGFCGASSLTGLTRAEPFSGVPNWKRLLPWWLTSDRHSIASTASNNIPPHRDGHGFSWVHPWVGLDWVGLHYATLPAAVPV